MRRLKRAPHRSITMSHLKYSTAVINKYFFVDLLVNDGQKFALFLCLNILPLSFVSGHVVRGEKCGPDREKLEQGEFVSLFHRVDFVSRKGIFVHFQERDHFCFILIGQFKRLIGFKRILSSQEHRRFNSNRPFPSSRVLLLRNESKCETFHIKISPHAVSISCKPKSKEWFRTQICFKTEAQGNPEIAY